MCAKIERLKLRRVKAVLPAAAGLGLLAALLSTAVPLPLRAAPDQAAAGPIPAQAAPDRALTIYNQNFAVVRQTVPLDLKAGLNHVAVSDITYHLEPDSVVLRDPSGKRVLQIREQNYRADPVSQELLLSLYEGKTIDFQVQHGDQTSVVQGKIVRSGYVPHTDSYTLFGPQQYGYQQQPCPPPGPPPNNSHPPDNSHPPPGQPETGQPGDRRPPHTGPPPGPSERSLRFFNFQGQPRDPGSQAAWDPAALADARRGRARFSTITSGGVMLRVLTQAAPPGGYVQAAYPLTEVNRTIAGLDRALLLLIPAALLAAGLGGALLTARVLRPVRQITQAAAAIGDAPAARLPAQGEDEFAQMAATFNGLLGRLNASFQRQAQLLDQQRRFTADASHELKSPLTVIQGTANQISYGGMSEAEACSAASEIAAAAAGMARLVQDLLLLARSDEGRLGQNKIRVLAREALAQAAARTARRGSPIQLQADAGLFLCGNEEELIRLFANLLQNAAQATPPAGTITVAARQQGAKTVVTVADTGSGIAPEHLPHLGERFYRTDAARTRRDGGTGLGLAICRSIAEAHGGRLTFTSVLGAGTTAIVTLPAEKAEG